MPIFYKDKLRILYIHVPKTGGSFIEHIFRHNGFKIDSRDVGGPPYFLNQIKNCSPQHMHAEMLRMVFQLNKMDCIFMTVRNPIDRFISEFIMRTKDKPPIDINVWLKNQLKEYRSNPFVQDNHLRPQIEFYLDGVTVYKQEDNFDEKWVASFVKEFGINIDINKVKKRRVNASDSTINEASHNTKKRNILNEESIKILSTWYRQDFFTFDYPLP